MCCYVWYWCVVWFLVYCVYRLLDWVEDLWIDWNGWLNLLRLMYILLFCWVRFWGWLFGWWLVCCILICWFGNKVYCVLFWWNFWLYRYGRFVVFCFWFVCWELVKMKIWCWNFLVLLYCGYVFCVGSYWCVWLFWICFWFCRGWFFVKILFFFVRYWWWIGWLIGCLNLLISGFVCCYVWRYVFCGRCWCGWCWYWFVNWREKLSLCWDVW